MRTTYLLFAIFLCVFGKAQENRFYTEAYQNIDAYKYEKTFIRPDGNRFYLATICSKEESKAGSIYERGNENQRFTHS